MTPPFPDYFYQPDLPLLQFIHRHFFRFDQMAAANTSACTGSASFSAAGRFRHLFPFLFQASSDLALKRYKACKHKEGARCKDKDRKRFIGIRHDLITEYRTGADQLTDDADAGQSDGESRPMPMPSKMDGSTGFLDA